MTKRKRQRLSGDRVLLQYVESAVYVDVSRRGDTLYRGREFFARGCPGYDTEDVIFECLAGETDQEIVTRLESVAAMYGETVLARVSRSRHHPWWWRRQAEADTHAGEQ